MKAYHFYNFYFNAFRKKIYTTVITGSAHLTAF